MFTRQANRFFYRVRIFKDPHPNPLPLAGEGTSLMNAFSACETGSNNLKEQKLSRILTSILDASQKHAGMTEYLSLHCFGHKNHLGVI